MTVPQDYKLLFESNPNPMWVFHRKTLRYLAVNEAAIKLYGYSRAEWMRMTPLDVRTPQEARKLRKYFREKGVPKRGGSGGAWVHRKKDGTCIDVEITSEWVTFEGQPAALIIAKDVSRRLQAERELERSREVLDSVVANAPDTIVLIDRRLKIRFVNRLSPRTKKSDVIGMDALDTIASASRAVVRRAFLKVFSTGQPQTYECQGRGPGGQWRWYRCRVGPVNRGSKVEQLVVVATDIEATRRGEAELAEFRAMWRGILDNAPDYIWTVNRAGVIQTINRVHEQLAREQVIGSSVWTWMTDPKHLRAFREAMRAVFDRKQSVVVEVEFAFPEGPLWFANRLAPIVEHGKVKSAVVVSSDVTEKKRVERAFEESRLMLDSILAGAPDAILSLDREGRIRFVNRIPPGLPSPIGKTVVEVTAPADRPAMAKALRGAMAGREQGVEGRGKAADGSTTWWRSRMRPVKRNGRVESVVMIAREVTAERKAADRLAQTQRRLAGVFNASRDGISFIDERGRFTDANDAFCRLTGYSRRELLRMSIFDITSPEHRGTSRAAVARIRGSSEPFEFEKEYVRKDGTRVDVSVSPFRIVDEPGNPPILAAMVREITERKRLEKAILDGGAEEQSRLGRELHDSLGQDLAGISLMARTLSGKLGKAGTPEADTARRIAETASASVEQVRALASGLIPTELIAQGLPAALRELGARAERLFGLACAVRCRETLPRISDTGLIHLYRVAQESLTNAAKHGRARRALVEIAVKGRRLTLRVTDDGVGFDGARSNGGMGLKIMRHRANMLGGTLELRRAQPRGTTVQLTCPCPA